MLFKLKSLTFIAKVIHKWPIILLLGISILLCILNYTPGTYLSGWDTLHPEFNFGLNIERTINGVFRTEQGLGAVAAHSHMADLPRIVILFIADFFLPTSFLRYFYINLCLILGPLGMYLFLNKHFFRQRTISFLGALFYLLNLGTIQTFNVPFEMFTTLFAALPFMFLFGQNYLFEKEHKKRSRDLLFFAIAVLFNSPSAYAATLWYIFFLNFFVYFLIHTLILSKNDNKAFRRFLNLIGVTLCINLFWIVPNVYFVLAHASKIAEANINLLFSDQAFYKNKEFGNLFDILLLKSFYFDWKIYAFNNQFIDLLSAFIMHLKNNFVLAIGMLFGLGFMLGGVNLFIKERIKSLPILSVIFISLIFLFNDNPPFSPIYNFLQKYVPFFKEALRFPDDKILNVFVFFVSILFAQNLAFISDKLKKMHHKMQAELLLIVLIPLLIIFYSLPAFSGNLINPLMRVNIPNQYFDLFKYLNTQPNYLRVSNWPLHSPFGWAYYDWNPSTGPEKVAPSFQGAGFLYFGIKQPLMDRDFDRWSPYNESYYREVSYAVYKNDEKLLKNVLEKYKIGFVFIDNSLINPQSSSTTLFFEKSDLLLNKTGLILDKKNFGNIKLYKLSSGSEFITATNTNINILPHITAVDDDFAYGSIKDYITAEDLPEFSTTYYPFRNLLNNQSKINPKFITKNSNEIILSLEGSSRNFEANNIFNNLNTISTTASLYLNLNTLNITFTPNLPSLDKNRLSKPQTKQITLSNNSSNLYLLINGEDLRSINNLRQNTTETLNEIKLINGVNNLSVFDQSKIIPIANINKVINPFFSACDNSTDSPTASILNNSINITGKGDICVLIPYSFLPKTAGEIIASLSFSFNGMANISSCLLNAQTGSCTSYKQAQINNNNYTFTHAFNAKDKQKMELKIFIKPINQGENTYLISGINAWYENPVNTITLTKDFINNMIPKANINSFKTIAIPISGLLEPEYSISQSKLTNNCKAKDAKKEIINGSAKYISNEGSFCDYYLYPTLAHNQAYLIAISSTNENGLPMTLCVSNNTTKRCDIYADLTSYKIQGKDYFVLSPRDSEGTGYSFSFENLGIKRTPSVNLLHSIEVMALPYDLLQSLKTKPTKSKISFNGKITSSSQYSSYIHIANVNQPTILTLNQSFEDGFKAYNIDCDFGISCQIKGLLAPLTGVRVDNHILVNSWANGWVIDSSVLKNSNTKIVIIYVPQYLEFIGFLVSFTTFILLLIHLKHEK